MWIDSHCHLNHEHLKPIGTPDDIIANAKANGIDGMLSICCRIEGEFPVILDIAKRNQDVWCTIGTHPHDAGLEAEKNITKSELVKRATSDPKIIGIGESGLDYYYNKSPHADQQTSFRKHIQACIETDLPLVVHARDADDDIIQILKEEGAGTNLRGVMHCFSSGAKMAEEALAMGFYMSASGIVTFKQADELRAIFKNVPLDKLLVETDAPYLAPMPHRGKTNQPAYVSYTGAELARIKEIDTNEMARITTENFFTLFNKARHEN
jgi:TatD DNase family protein